MDVPSRRRAIVAIPALVTLLIGSATPANADPIVLGSAVIESGSGSNGPAITDVRFIFAVTPIASVQLFSEHVLTAASVGRTFVATAANDPDFAEVARQLTNGVGNYIEWQVATSSGAGGSGYPGEGILFGLSTPDFRGATIESLSFRLDSFSNPVFPGGAQLRLTGLLEVIGSNGSSGSDPVVTPEPGTLMLITTGAVGILARKRRR